MSQYENSSDKQVTELTGEQSWMHGISVLPWDKPCAGGTLESMVCQATNHANVPSHSNMHNQVDDGVGLPFFGINSTTHGEYGGTSTMPSPENTYCAGLDYHDTISHTKSQKKQTGDHENGKRKLSIEKSSVSTKKAKTAAIHNQSERKRRERINQRLNTLQEMVPNCCKTDKASMLDDVIKCLEKHQAQDLKMSTTINMSSMILPLMQQELQTFMMRMCMRMGMGVMDMMNTINCPAVQPVIPSASTFMPDSLVNLGDCLSTPPTSSVMSDPLPALLACQSQPMTADMYNRLAAILQQMQPPSTSKP